MIESEGQPKARERAKRALMRLFAFGDRLGIHVLPAHYYSPVAHRRWLHANEERWRHPSTLVGVDWDLDEQAEWVATVAGDYPSELPISDIVARAEAVGGFRYGPIEAQFLYAYLRRYAPRKIVEIGSGSSTLVMSAAVQRNVAEGKAATDIVAFDPIERGDVATLPHVRFERRGGLDVQADALGLEAGD